MKLLIKRASMGRFPTEKPCDEAKLLYTNEYDESVWYIELNSLIDLVLFQNKYGPVIFDVADFPDKNHDTQSILHEIKIYDFPVD